MHWYVNIIAKQWDWYFIYNACFTCKASRDRTNIFNIYIYIYIYMSIYNTYKHVRVFANPHAYNRNFTYIVCKQPAMPNNSNFTVGTVRVKAGLPGTSAACAFFNKCIPWKCLLNEGQGHGAQHSKWIRWQLYTNHTWASFASSHSFRDIHISNFVILKMYVKVTMNDFIS